MIKIIKNNYKLIIFFLFFSVISSIYFFSFLKNPAFNLIDDGTSLQVANEIMSGDFNKLVEIKNGRIRPLYWLYFTFIYIFSGNNPLGFWVGQTMIFSLTLFSIWFLLIDKKNRYNLKSYLIALLLPTLFFIPAISENLFRLGTAEVRQTLLIIWFMIWMKESIKKNIPNWIGYVIFTLAILTKETSILLLPVAFIFFVPHIIGNFKKNRSVIYSLSFFSFFSLVFYFIVSILKKSSTYSTNFTINFEQIKSNLFISRLDMSDIYYLLLTLITFTVIRLIVLLINKKEDNTFKVLFKFWKENSLITSTLAALFLSLLFVFSWEYQLERYYYPVYIFLLIYSAIELMKSTRLFLNIRSYKYKIFIIVFPVLVVLTSYNTIFQKIAPNLKNYLNDNSKVKDLWYFDYQNSYLIINFLIKENITKIYTLVDDYEVIYELGLFANKIDFAKNKIVTISPNEEIINKHIYFNYSNDIKNDFMNDENKDTILITIESENINLDNKYYIKNILIDESLNKYSDKPNWIIWRKK